MRKYLIAGVVAVMVFAFSAFAATLAVNGGTLQVGQDGVACTSDAQVYAWGYNDHLTPATVSNVAVALPGHVDECVGENINLAVLDGAGNVLQRVSKLADEGEDQGRFEFAGDGVDVRQIVTVRIAIETGGPGVGTWDDSPLSSD